MTTQPLPNYNASDTHRLVSRAKHCRARSSNSVAHSGLHGGGLPMGCKHQVRPMQQVNLFDALSTCYQVHLLYEVRARIEQASCCLPSVLRWCYHWSCIGGPDIRLCGLNERINITLLLLVTERFIR